MRSVSGFEITEELFAAGTTRVCRARQQANGRLVILKVLSGETPRPELLAQYQREYEITDSLKDIPGVINVYGIEVIQGSLMIVEEDIGGVALGDILASGKLGLEEALLLAISLAEIIGSVHEHHVIHKDINPSNIVWNRGSGELRLIDFGISSRLSQELMEFQNINQLEGSLAYISPEQTGRVNRSLDSRSDLYSLGVTLYQIFTGRRPFASRASIELVHAHIAVTPPSPHDIDPTIPPMISAIIMRLLAKMADQRYQSACGLRNDLERCLLEFRANGVIRPFALGEDEPATRLNIPQKLYGRDKEIESILASFDRVAEGACELLLVSGASGIGKSALAHEVYHPLTNKRGSFIAGKFDQYQRDIPFYAWRQALEQLGKLLLKEDEIVLAGWRQKIVAALGTLGKVLAELMPSIELILGEQPEVPPLSGEQALNRLNYVFANFLAAICDKQHPVVIFIDDWQWADAASVALLKSVMQAPGLSCLLLIAAYRDNEVYPAHPFSMAVEASRKRGDTLNAISLLGLSEQDVALLIQDTLGHSSEIGKLSHLIYEKTLGNAFFVVHLLTDLYQKSIIRFSPESKTWVWQQEAIEAIGVADNVVELMAGKIRKFPATVQQSLIFASCIGDRFSLATLASILGQPFPVVAAELEQALQEGILLPVGQQYRLAQHSATGDQVFYQFVHDRVRQAAYGLLEEGAGEKIHYDIANIWIREFSPTVQEQLIFDIANQYNAGRRLITSAEEQERLLTINLKAGTRAKSATAYTTALYYFRMALDLRAENCWQLAPRSTADLLLLAAESAFLSKDYGVMEGWLDEYLDHIVDNLERVKAYKIRLQAYVAQNRLSEAVDVALHALSLLGIRLSKKPHPLHVMGRLLQTKYVLRGKSFADLGALPAMTDPVRLAAMDILGLTIPPAYWTSQELVALIVFQMVRESVVHGYSPNAAYGYSWWGVTESAMLGNIDSGYKFGEFAIQLARQHNLSLQQPMFFAAWLIRKFKHPLKDTIPLFEQTYALSLEKGDFEYASYAKNNEIQALFHCGCPLDVLLPKMAEAEQELQRFQIGSSLFWHHIWWQAAINLTSAGDRPTLFEGPAYDENISLPQHLKVQDISTLFLLYFAKLMVCCLLNDRSGALVNARQARAYLKGGVGTHAFSLFHCYESLAFLAELEHTEPKKTSGKSASGW